MHFCVNCNNMYYIRISNEDGNSLVYYCRKCGHEETNLVEDKLCVSKTRYKYVDQNYGNVINKYTKEDPTLPRVNNIPCPNKECSTNKEDGAESREILYIRYDDVNLKFVYLCSSCNTIWKADDI
jgi:DNA-directed RNA polymerase subunit M/transcription elongation factor TFIIS